MKVKNMKINYEWFRWVIHTPHGDAIEENPYMVKEGDKIVYGGLEYVMSHYSLPTDPDDETQLCLIFLPVGESSLNIQSIRRDMKLDELIPTKSTPADADDELPF